MMYNSLLKGVHMAADEADDPGKQESDDKAAKEKLIDDLIVIVDRLKQVRDRSKSSSDGGSSGRSDGHDAGGARRGKS
jgi:hypothetical protein